MRGYSVAATALALNVDRKWLDNLLSQHRVAGVAQSRQGVQRKLSPGSLHRIATVYSLNRDLLIPVAAAIRLADELWQDSPQTGAGDEAALRFGDITVLIRRAEIRARVEAALADALEMAPRTRRGRPPARRGV